MNKKIIALIVAALVVVAAGLYAFSRPSSDNLQTSNQAQPEAKDEAQVSFSPIPTEGRSFEARIDGKSDTAKYKATILYDGEGNAKFSGTNGSQSYEAYTVDSGFILCNDGSCYKLPGSGGQVPVTKEQFSYGQAKLDEFAKEAEYKGEESCPAGTCKVWEIVTPENTTRVYLADDNTVSQLTSDGDDGQFTITYDYKDVTIDVPQNVQSFPETP